MIITLCVAMLADDDAGPKMTAPFEKRMAQNAAIKARPPESLGTNTMQVRDLNRRRGSFANEEPAPVGGGETVPAEAPIKAPDIRTGTLTGSDAEMGQLTARSRPAARKPASPAAPQPDNAQIQALIDASTERSGPGTR